MVEEVEGQCDWRIIPRCIIPQLSLFIQLDKQIILPSLFIPIIIRHRASQQKNIDNHQFKIKRLQTVDFHNLAKRVLLSDSELPLCNILCIFVVTSEYHHFNLAVLYFVQAASFGQIFLEIE